MTPPDRARQAGRAPAVPAASAPAPPSVLGRAALILDVIDHAGGSATLAAVSRRTGLPRSTTHRLCGELVEHGLLAPASSGYRLGPRLLTLGETAQRGVDLRDAARPHMEDLGIASGGLTVQLAVLVDTEIIQLEVLRSAHAPRLGSRAGARQPAHATASGKAILAFSPPDVVAARLDAGLVRLTPRTIGTATSLRRELASVRATGVALDREESAVGLLALAAPVFGPGDRVVASLGLSGLSARVLPAMTPAVRTAALALSRTLGARRHTESNDRH